MPAWLPGVDYPIVQGPFGGGYSTPQLVAAVSNGGGLGSLGAYQQTPDEILQTAREIRALTSRPFNLNLWVSTHDAGADQPSREAMLRLQDRLRPCCEELGIEPALPPVKPIPRFEAQVEALFEARPAVFSFVFGIPSKKILQEARRLGIVLAGAATTLDEALALDAADVDVIVASGFEAGGHRPSFLAAAEDSLVGTFALTAQVAARVTRPVIAAGGIATAVGVAAALRLGASGVQVGTAFLACEESGAPPLHRELLFTAAAHHTMLSRAFTGRLGRAVANRIADTIGDAPLLPFPAQGWMVGTLRAAALRQQRADLVTMWCGQSAALLRHRSAADVLAELAQGLER